MSSLGWCGVVVKGLNHHGGGGSWVPHAWSFPNLGMISPFHKISDRKKLGCLMSANKYHLKKIVQISARKFSACIYMLYICVVI